MKAKSVLSLLLCLCLLLSVPMTARVTADLEGVTTFVWSGNSVAVQEGADTAYKIVVVDDQGVESVPETATNSNGDPVYSLPYGIKGELEVGIKKAGGQYAFQGTGTGHIVVKKAATGDATVYLNGLTLTSTITATLAVNKDSTAKCTVHVVAGTENTLSDAAANDGDANPNNLMAENAVMKFKGGSNVTLTGDGTLTLNSNAKNGIKANELLTIEGNGILNVNAKDDGISGENTITVNSGTVNITSQEGDGIKCGADDTADGDIVIDGGTITIDAYGDGMQATANLTVNGGVLKITCYGGADSQYVSGSTVYPSAKGLKAGGTYVDASNTEVSATECFLTIRGGYITVNSPDDALHSNKDITIEAGVLNLYTSTSSGDGIHADKTTTLGKSGAKDTDLYLTVHKCYEGIEGETVVIHSGVINVFAADDSINAASATGTSTGGRPGGSSGSSAIVTVNGGLVYCASTSGDCLDSNGTFTITGGTLVVLGSLTSRDNTAVDTDGSFNIQGGQILTIGQSSMLTNPTTTQNYCTWTAAGTVTASASGSTGSGSNTRPGAITKPSRPGSSSGSAGGSVVSNNQQVTVTDASGKVLISVVAQWNNASSGSASYVLYSSSDLTAGSNYTLTVGTAQEVTGGSNITVPGVAAQPEVPDKDEPSVPSYPPVDGSSSESTPSDSTSSDSTPSDPTESDTPSDTSSELNYRLGDVNGDGSINATDALMILQNAVKLIELQEAQALAADVTGEGDINASDALCVLQYTVKLIDRFPAEQ